jgi:hypothetical protein
MLHINMLEKVREDWQSEHIKACEVGIWDWDRKQLGMGLIFLLEPENLFIFAHCVSFSQ